MAIKILVIEDDRDLRRNMQRLLEGEGYIVVLAENGLVALDHLQNTTEFPDLILLDLMMPIMDGFQFREAQERSLEFGAIPVVILTADGHTDEKRMKTGAVAALRKPASVSSILDTITKVLNIRAD